MPLSDDRYREILQGVYERTDEEAPVAPTWFSIPTRATHSVRGWRGPLVALGVAAAALIVAVPILYLGQSETTQAPAGGTDTEGVIVLVHLADSVSNAQLDAAIDTLTTDPRVIEWRFVDKDTALAEALAQFADDASMIRVLNENPGHPPASIRLLVANVADAAALASMTAELSGVIATELGWGTLATTLALVVPPETFYEVVETTTTTLDVIGGAIACPVTIPPQPGFLPPDGYPSTPAFGVWYGTDGLWTVIETEGISRPRKTVLWSVNFPGGREEEQPKVDVTWTRLDILAEPISNGGDATNAYTLEDGDFMIAGRDPNEPGCWQVTAKYKGATLTYVYAVPAESAIPPTADPLFDDESPWILLFDDGPGGVLAIDPNNPIGVRSTVYGDRAGDQPYRMTRVGGHLVVGWGIMYATSIISGDSTPLGAASIYVLASEPDRVWLIDWAADSGETTAWQVDMEGRVVVERASFPGSAFPGIGIPGGIAIETDTGLEAWYPNAENPEVIWGDRQASVLDVNGTVLAFCPTEPCTDPHFIEIGTGRVSKVGLPSEVAGPVRERRSARFSPDGSKMALATDQGIVILDLETLLFTTVAQDLTNTQRPAYVSWSPDGEVLFASVFSVGDIDMTIVRYNIASRDLQTAQLPYRGGIDFLVLDRTEAALYLNTNP